MLSQLLSLTLVVLLLLLLLQPASGFHSTKTAYADSFGPAQARYIANVSHYVRPGCAPVQIYLFLRHGARYPNHKQVVRSKHFLDEVRAQRAAAAQPADLLLDTIAVTFDDKPHYALSELGEREMHSIAKRFAERYASLFRPIATAAAAARSVDSDAEDNLLLYAQTQSSSKERSIDSAKSFLHGLFHNASRSEDPHAAQHQQNSADALRSPLGRLIAAIQLNNTMLRLFSECARYLRDIEDNHAATHYLYEFKTGKEMNQLVDEFKTRHNLRNLHVEAGTLIKLFTLCNIEHAHRMPHNWCKLFTPHDYEVLAYYNDLKGYWKKSYGHEINANMAFLLIKEAFASMDDQIRSVATSNPKVLMRFGHAENMFPLITALGLFHDTELRMDAQSFEQNLGRKFRSGVLTPFSANLAFVLHKCTNVSEVASDEDDPTSNYMVHVLVNELPVNMLTNGGELACGKDSADGSWCSYGALRRQLRKYIEQDYAGVCEVNTGDKFKDNKTISDKISGHATGDTSGFKVDL